MKEKKNKDLLGNVKNGTFYIENEEGEEVPIHVLFTYESQEFGKNYIVYTLGDSDDEGNVEVTASIYDPESYTLDLSAIETDEEWALIEEVLDLLKRHSKNVVKDYLNGMIAEIDEEIARREELEALESGDVSAVLS